MTTLISLAIFAAFVWVLHGCSHEDEVIERDEEHGCHKVACLHCGRAKHLDPYGGIEG